MTQHQRDLILQYVAIDVVQLLDICPCPNNLQVVRMKLPDSLVSLVLSERRQEQFKYAWELAGWIAENDALFKDCHSIGAGRAMNQEEAEEHGISKFC